MTDYTNDIRCFQKASLYVNLFLNYKVYKYNKGFYTSDVFDIEKNENGVFISKWNVELLGNKPTWSEIFSFYENIDKTIDLEASTKLWFYVQNNLNYTGTYDENLYFIYKVDDASVILDWNLPSSKPTWSQVFTYYDATEKYPPGTYPIIINGTFGPDFTLLIKYNLMNNVITINIPEISVNFSGTGSILTSLNPVPAAVRPTSTLYFLKSGTNNGIKQTVNLCVDIDGYVYLYSDLNCNENSVFGGVAGMDGTSISYII